MCPQPLQLWIYSRTPNMPAPHDRCFANTFCTGASATTFDRLPFDLHGVVDVRDIECTNALCLHTGCIAMLFHSFSSAWIDKEDAVKTCVDWTPSTSFLFCA